MFGQALSQRTRTIPFSSRPISESLQPDDQVVIIDREKEGAVFVRQPSARQTIEYAVRSSDLAAVVKVDDVGGILVQGGSWVDTRVAGTISDVLMAGKRRVVRGQRLEFLVSGGEMMIGSVRVKAWDKPKVEAQKQYLVFLQGDPETGVFYPSYGPRLIEQARVVGRPQSELGGKIHDPLDGLTLETVAAEVRRLGR
jgi:hypothetical protein